MDARTHFKICGLMIFALLAWTPPARAYTLTSGGLVEDFTTLDGADLTATTGVWNIVDTRAQAGVVANGTAANTISFGDGSDGALSASSGTVTFNTDLRPNGFNTRHGIMPAPPSRTAQPLIIRSSHQIFSTIASRHLAAQQGVGNGHHGAHRHREVASTAARAVVNVARRGDGGNGTTPRRRKTRLIAAHGCCHHLALADFTLAVVCGGGIWR